MAADSPLKLDERTEQLLLWLANGSKRVGTPDVVEALRSCIKELQAESYKAGRSSPDHPVLT